MRNNLSTYPENPSIGKIGVQTILAATFGLALTFTLGCEEKSGGKTADNPKPAAEATASVEFAKAKEAAPTAKSDTLIYEWRRDICDYTGYYLSSQYSKEKVETIYKLWERAKHGMNDYSSVFKPEDIKKIDIPKFTKEYQNLMKYLDDSRKSISVPFWKNYIAEQKSFAQKFYYLKKMELEAFANPTILLSNKYPKPDCDKYAQALASGDTTLILETWKRHSEERNNNMQMERFYQEYNSSDKYLYAQIDLLGTGWWNCINPYGERDDEYSTQIENEFKKLFVRVNEECEAD